MTSEWVYVAFQVKESLGTYFSGEYLWTAAAVSGSFCLLKFLDRKVRDRSEGSGVVSPLPWPALHWKKP